MSNLSKIMSAHFPRGWVSGVNASGCCDCRELATVLVLYLSYINPRLSNDQRGKNSAAYDGA
jgi:hypothetical protein